MKHILTIISCFAVLSMGAQVPAYLSTDGLTAWYPMDGDVLDYSGSGLNGTEENPMQFLDADCDEGQYVTNQGDGSVILPSQAINFPNQLTIAYRFRLHSNEAATIFRHGQGGEMHSVYNQFNDDKLYYSIKFNDDNWYKASVSIPDVQEWCSVVATYNGYEDSLRIYTNFGDEAAVATPNTGLWNYNIPTQISMYIQGDVDDFAIWSREINDDERLAYLNAWCNACNNPQACNFSAEEACVFPSEGYDCDGICINDSDGDGVCDEFEVFGCLDPMACNFNSQVTEVIDNCDYTCCPGPGCCGDGTYWDLTTSTCLSLENCEDDLDGDGVIGVNDLMQLLSSFGTDCPLVEPAEWTCGNPVSYHGYDYETVLIGEQCWFAENLRTELYQNGDSIILAEETLSWQSNGTPFQCVWQNDLSSIENWGRLYNWWAITDDRSICPIGWTVPNNNQFEILIDFAGGWGTGLITNNTDDSPFVGSNETEWTGVFSGFRSNGGEFSDFENQDHTFWWTSEFSDGYFGQAFQISSTFYPVNSGYSKRHGFSVRCVSD